MLLAIPENISGAKPIIVSVALIMMESTNPRDLKGEECYNKHMKRHIGVRDESDNLFKQIIKQAPELEIRKV